VVLTETYFSAPPRGRFEKHCVRRRIKFETSEEMQEMPFNIYYKRANPCSSDAFASKVPFIAVRCNSGIK
jgi:hypothetical protein